MKIPARFFYSTLTLLLISNTLSVADVDIDRSANPPKPTIPEELFDDEHVREEYGINQFTTPSITQLFANLDALGDIPYDELRPNVPSELPSNRIRLALNLGIFIADGFLAVQAENLKDIESVGRAIFDASRTFGVGKHLSRHNKALLKNSLLGDWGGLKEELAATQKDVELEMLLLRDQQITHLVSLGGWIRALDIASTSALHSQQPHPSQALDKQEIIEYFAAGLDTLAPSLQESELIQDLKEQIAALRLTLNPDKPSAPNIDKVILSQKVLQEMQNHARSMIRSIRQNPEGKNE